MAWLGFGGPPVLFWVTMMMMKMGTMITIIIIIIIYSNVFMFLWLVDGRLLPTCLVTIITLLTVGRFGGNCHKVAMGQLSQGSAAGIAGSAAGAWIDALRIVANQCRCWLGHGMRPVSSRCRRLHYCLIPEV